MSEIIQQQIAYYRSRSKEYDEWFYREGHYDQGEELNRKWTHEAQLVREQLLDAPISPSILEMACGTGIWTQELIKIGETVTALDASVEMIEINKAKLNSDKVTYMQTNLFEWQPDQQYDMVFFGFWLSHVPDTELSKFLTKVYDALKPDGRLFFVDSQKVRSSTSGRQSVETHNDIQKRVLNDGSQFEIVKIYYDPENLTEKLREHGFSITVQTTPTYFIYADGKK